MTIAKDNSLRQTKIVDFFRIAKAPKTYRQSSIKQYYNSTHAGTVPTTPRSHRWRATPYRHPATPTSSSSRRAAPVTPSSSTRKCTYCKTGSLLLATPPATRHKGKSSATTPKCTKCRQFLFCDAETERNALWGPCPKCRRGHRERFICSVLNFNNANRQYFKCSKASDGCGYFEWKGGN